MNVLFLVQKHQRIQLDTLYDGIGEHVDMDIRWLSSDEQRKLSRYFKRSVDTARYDRIIFFLRFKKEIRQVAFIRTVPNIVILEHDACQNYYPGTKYEGKFSRHYHAIPWARVLVSGYQVAKKLREEGYDAVFVSKGYDDNLLKNLNKERNIELGFIGSLRHRLYSKRKEFLLSAKDQLGLELIRTDSGDEYLQALNNIKYFVGADIGLGEYMIKNFEAMACGCVLFAWDQGREENEALGFKDMKNIVLYRSIEELKSKLDQVRSNGELAKSIATTGQRLVEEQYGFTQIGKKVADAIKPALRNHGRVSRFDKLRYMFRR